MFRSTLLASALTLGVVAAPAHAQLVVSTVVPVPSYTVIPVHSYTVQFRALDWTERIFHNPIDAREFELLKRAEGFETMTSRYGCHTQVRYRLPYWQSYRTVSSHHLAGELARHLEYRGYEARIVRY